MIKLLIRYLRARKYRSIIEKSRDPKLTLWGVKLESDAIQAEQHLSLEKLYCLAWMIVNGKKTLTLDDVVKLRQLRNLQDTIGAKKLKEFIYLGPGVVKRDRSISYEELISLVEDVGRFDSVLQKDHVENLEAVMNEIGTEATRRSVWTNHIEVLKRIHEKHLCLFRAYPEIGWNKLRAVMTFEVDHLTALRGETFLQRDMEILYKQRSNVNWPPTHGERNLKLGWIMFLPQLDGSIRIDEIQAPIEEPLKAGEEGGGMVPPHEAGGRMVRPPAFTGFMLQQFLQYFILRGVTRFTIPTLDKRRAMTQEGLTTLESNYRDLPKAFGFERKGSFWVLDFNQS